jgi:hypothetical protein
MALPRFSNAIEMTRGRLECTLLSALRRNCSNPATRNTGAECSRSANRPAGTSVLA